MLQLLNETPFEVGFTVLPDPDGRDTVYVAIKASFSVAGDRVSVAPEQRPLREADEYAGEPGESSIAWPGDVHLRKPGTDVLLLGHARPANGRPVERIGVRVRVGALTHEMVVTGDRHWTGSLVGKAMTPPIPFDAMPLSWERAYGGAHEQEDGETLYEPRNPVGVGFRGKRKRKEMAKRPVPNIESPAALLTSLGDTPEPAGSAPIAPNWAPRITWAGTYDDDWIASRAPFLPQDFDPRFFHVAPPGLVSESPLEGGEPVELLNVSPEGPLRFVLPTCALDATISISGSPEKRRPQLETVLFAPDDALVEMVWRADVPCDKKAFDVETVNVKLERMTGVTNA